MKTADFLDALKARHNLPSDYAAAKFLGLTQAQVSRYRNGRDFFGDVVAMRVAELLDMPPGYVLACIHAERATDSAVAKVWTKLAASAKRGSATAAAVILSVLFSGGPDAGASASTRAGTLAPAHVVAVATLYIVTT